jgi:hypothetical protein
MAKQEIKQMTGFALMPCKQDGRCQVCATHHEPELPHNQQSLYYQYSFYSKHGRWPTWFDAMDHCSNKVKKVTKDVLREQGIELGKEPSMEEIIPETVPHPDGLIGSITTRPKRKKKTKPKEG